jgi:transposase-like protein
MRAVHAALRVEYPRTALPEFADAWREQDPAMIDSWETRWGEFVPFVEFPVELRKIVCSNRESMTGNTAGNRS